MDNQLYNACMSNDLPFVIDSIKNGAKVNIKQDRLGLTLLMVASSNGYIEIVKELLKNGADVNAKKNNGNAPLIMASSEGFLEVVKELLLHGANVNTTLNNGFSSLTLASFNGHTEVVRELLDNNADPTIKTYDGFTALDYAGYNASDRLSSRMAIFAIYDDRDFISCDHCKKVNPTEHIYLCSRCYNHTYCNQECQRSAWVEHKKTCKFF
jgi:ankyrin repeat protein